MTQRIFIVRHGETDYNAEGRWQGQIDVALNAQGFEQAQKLAAHFERIQLDAIFSSDLSRAYETAQTVATLKQMPVITNPRLREISVGVFEGLIRSEIRTQYPKELETWDADESFVPPRGESRLQLQQRAYEVWLELCQLENYETILVLSHGAFIRMLLKKLIPAHEFETLRHVANTSISLFEKKDDEWQLVFMNQTPHLE